LSEIKDPEGIYKLSRIINYSEKCYLGELKKPDGTYTTSMKESMEVLMNEHFPGNYIPIKQDKPKPFVFMKHSELQDQTVTL